MRKGAHSTRSLITVRSNGISLTLRLPSTIRGLRACIRHTRNIRVNIVHLRRHRDIGRQQAMDMALNHNHIRHMGLRSTPPPCLRTDLSSILPSTLRRTRRRRTTRLHKLTTPVEVALSRVGTLTLYSVGHRIKVHLRRGRSSQFFSRYPRPPGHQLSGHHRLKLRDRNDRPPVRVAPWMCGARRLLTT